MHVLGARKLYWHRVRTLVQQSRLFTVSAWGDQLRLKYNIEHVYFQEPEFNVFDEDSLKSRGYEILHTPESDNYMSETTFLFTPGAEQVILESTLLSAFPMLYITRVLTIHGAFYVPREGPLIRYKQQRENKLPAPCKAHRKLIDSFLSQRAVKVLPNDSTELFNWFRELRICYKPDNDSDVSSYEWGIKEHETYTHKQAVKVWRQRGVIDADYRDPYPYSDSEDDTSSAVESAAPCGATDDRKAHFEASQRSSTTDYHLC